MSVPLDAPGRNGASHGIDSRSDPLPPLFDFCQEGSSFWPLFARTISMLPRLMSVGLRYGFNGFLCESLDDISQLGFPSDIHLALVGGAPIEKASMDSTCRSRRAS